VRGGPALSPRSPRSPHGRVRRYVVAHLIEPPLRITLLAQNAAGWAQLCRLVSAAHAVADGTSPIVPEDPSCTGFASARPDTCGQALRERRAAVFFVAFFSAVFAGCLFAVFFFGSSWTSTSSPREALACWTDSVRAAHEIEDLARLLRLRGDGGGSVPSRMLRTFATNPWCSARAESQLLRSNTPQVVNGSAWT
jgi:hypothetical protein